MNKPRTPNTSMVYPNFMDEITKRIRATQFKTLKAIDNSMIELYKESSRLHFEPPAARGWEKSAEASLLARPSEKGRETSSIQREGRAGHGHASSLRTNQMQFSNQYSQKLMSRRVWNAATEGRRN